MRATLIIQRRKRPLNIKIATKVSKIYGIIFNSVQRAQKSHRARGARGLVRSGCGWLVRM